MIEGITGKQELFNYVARHLLEQNERCIDPEDGGCAYRDDVGRRCAIGCLIDDKHYSKSLEGLRLTATCVMDAVEGSIGRKITGRYDCSPHTERIVLKRLQGIHDAEEVEDWPTFLRAAAHDYELQLPDCLKETAV